ncbi:MAG: PIG-L family deacetylase [Candidatus Hodarchaeales archaeon]|jgi:LmbE family N-acetylglucosaminyl deacetylase
MTDDDLDIIAVDAHPDDVELGCSGFLFNLANQGYRTGIIDLTDGEPTPYNDDPSIRLAEARESASILDCKQRITLDMPNRKLMDTIEARIKLATEFRKYHPKIILVPYGHTPLASPDHYQAQLITDSAIFYSQLSKWSKYFGSLQPHKIYSVIYYTTGREIIPTSSNLFPFYEDISKVWDTKVKAIKSYKSQFQADKRSLDVITWIESLNRYWGYELRVFYAEKFFSSRPVQLKSVKQFF